MGGLTIGKSGPVGLERFGESIFLPDAPPKPLEEKHIEEENQKGHRE